jgi:hypothetical protein
LPLLKAAKISGNRMSAKAENMMIQNKEKEYETE